MLWLARSGGIWVGVLTVRMPPKKKPAPSAGDGEVLAPAKETSATPPSSPWAALTIELLVAIATFLVPPKWVLCRGAFAGGPCGGQSTEDLLAGVRHLGRLACASRQFSIENTGRFSRNASSSALDEACYLLVGRHPQWAQAQQPRGGQSCLQWLYGVLHAWKHTHPLLFTDATGTTGAYATLMVPTFMVPPAGFPSSATAKWRRGAAAVAARGINASARAGGFNNRYAKGTAVCGKNVMRSGVHYAEFTLREGQSARIGVVHSKWAFTPHQMIATDTGWGWGYRARTGQVEHACDEVGMVEGLSEWEGMQPAVAGDTIGMKLDFTDAEGCLGAEQAYPEAASGPLSAQAASMRFTSEMLRPPITLTAYKNGCAPATLRPRVPCVVRCVLLDYSQSTIGGDGEGPCKLVVGHP